MRDTLELVGESREKDDLLFLLAEVLGRILGEFWNVLPGDTWDVQTADPGVAAPATPDVISLLEFNSTRSDPVVLRGLSTSPTANTVRYILRANGNTVLETDHQLSVDIFTLYAMGQQWKEGPVQFELLAGSMSAAPVAGVFGRLAGWYLGSAARGGVRRMKY